MAKTYVVTEQTMWTRLTATKSTWYTVPGALSGPGDYAHTKTLWTTDFDPNSGSDAGRVVVSGLPESGSIAWKFYSSANDGDTGEARIWGISKVFDAGAEPDATEYFAEYLCKLDLTSGTAGVANDAGSDILPACKFVDTIAVVDDKSLIPGVRVISSGDEAAATIVLDGLGYWGYIVEIAPKVQNTTDWGALYRAF